MKVQLLTIPVKPSVEGLEIAKLVLANYKRQGWRIAQANATTITLKKVTR